MLNWIVPVFLVNLLSSGNSSNSFSETNNSVSITSIHKSLKLYKEFEIPDESPCFKLGFLSSGLMNVNNKIKLRVQNICVYSFQYKINVAKVHLVSDRGIVAQEEGGTQWFYYFYTLRGVDLKLAWVGLGSPGHYLRCLL